MSTGFPAAGNFASFPNPQRGTGHWHEPKDAIVSTGRKSQLLLGFGGLAIALLLAAIFTLGSLTLPFEPRQWDLYALTGSIAAPRLFFVAFLPPVLWRLGAGH